MHLRRTLARSAALAGATGLLTWGLAAPASAHVTVTPSGTAAGEYVVLTFSVPHGCDGSPTTGVAIQVPEEILAVTPTRNPYYDVTTKMVKLDEPVEDAHGNRLTERVGAVVYDAKVPLPDGDRDTLELSLQLPDAAGETLAFPVLQTCAKGETAWSEVPAEGQDPDELEHPAPAVTITGAGTDGAAPSSGAAADDEDDDDGGNAFGIAGLVVGAVGVAVGGTALARTRRQS